MQRSLRHKAIIRAVQSGGRVSVAALADLTGASTITIRRDLTVLAKTGVLVRTHGGATRAIRGGHASYAERLGAEHQVKLNLGEAAAALVSDRETVLIDNGTTVLAVARCLATRPIVAMPLSLHAAMALTGGDAEVLLPGGPLERDTLAMSSVGAINAIRDFPADTFILGTCSARPDHGLASETYTDAEVKKAGIRSAARTILVASGTKLRRQASFVFARCEDLDYVVTTDDAPAELLAMLSVAGVAVQLIARSTEK